MSGGRAQATAFAPATVANVAVGFDILGFAIDGVGDRVTVKKIPEKTVRITRITGVPGANEIPCDAITNTGGVPLLNMIERCQLGFGFEVTIEKGITLGSGMGGSAASAVGAVVAANALLDQPLSREILLDLALDGEALASGARHADNIAPCLYGGMTLSEVSPVASVIELPFPRDLRVVVVNPGSRLDTKQARGVLKREIELKTHIAQSRRLAMFIAGLCESNYEWIKRGCEDVVIEPQRAHLIPGFAAVKKSALGAGALGCSISGAGPSVFALVQGAKTADTIRDAMIRAFAESGSISAQGWVSEISSRGAIVL